MGAAEPDRETRIRVRALTPPRPLVADGDRSPRELDTTHLGRLQK